MARETLFQLHHLQQNSLKCRGFTLLELIIAMSVMVVLLGAAAPSFSDLIERNKIKRLATEIEWLLVHAKSEAVMRGKKVYVKSTAPNIPSRSITTWNISSSLESGNHVFSVIDANSFSHILVTNSPKLRKFYFDPIYGKPSTNGSYLYSIGGYKLKTTVYNITGRIYTCFEADSEKLSGYEKC
ncbi:prepilin-type N-terminal cleavage/methylation domain-containing protein [Photobacterium damselae]|nr:prepilin-type N-terminal cleavage/methylation domain-containing protein [Photobacterium damselae]